MKAGMAVVAVAAALSLSGCSAGGGDARQTAAPTDSPDSPPASATTTSPAQPATATASPSGTATATGSATADSAGTGDGATHSVEGVWLAAQGDSKVQLVLGKGEANLTSNHLCGGAYTEKNGVDIRLTCMDGDKERTRGLGVMAPDGSTLTVQWTGGLTDVFTRTGLPSD
jgi:hypothetical protein